jgi:hypothetical protein
MLCVFCMTVWILRDIFCNLLVMVSAKNLAFLCLFRHIASGIETAKNDIDIIARRLKQVLEQEKGKI